MKKNLSFISLLLLIPCVSAFAGLANLPGAAVYYTATTPTAGVNEIQTLTFGGTPAGGTFQIRFNNRVSGNISWSATNATLVSNIDTALEAMFNIGTGGVVTAVGTMTAGVGTITVTFQGVNAKLDVPLMTVNANNMTGSSPTLSIATTTAGVTADGRNSKPGSLLVAQDTGHLYVNTGTLLSPVWSSLATP